MNNSENDSSSSSSSSSEEGVSSDRASEIDSILLDSTLKVDVKMGEFSGPAISYFEFPADVILRVGLVPPNLAMIISKQMLELAMLSPLDAQTVNSMSYIDLVSTVEMWVMTSQTRHMETLAEMQGADAIEGPEHESVDKLKQMLNDLKKNGDAYGTDGL